MTKAELINVVSGKTRPRGGLVVALSLVCNKGEHRVGSFRITVEAVGGHGCQRDIGDGGIVKDCQVPHCPDCTARRFVEKLIADGNMVSRAQIEHWPVDMGAQGGPVDDLLTGKRSGSF